MTDDGTGESDPIGAMSNRQIRSAAIEALEAEGPEVPPAVHKVDVREALHTTTPFSPEETDALAEASRLCMDLTPAERLLYTTEGKIAKALDYAKAAEAGSPQRYVMLDLVLAHTHMVANGGARDTILRQVRVLAVSGSDQDLRAERRIEERVGGELQQSMPWSPREGIAIADAVNAGIFNYLATPEAHILKALTHAGKAPAGSPYRETMVNRVLDHVGDVADPDTRRKIVEQARVYAVNSTQDQRAKGMLVELEHHPRAK